MKKIQNKNLLVITNGYPNKEGTIVDSVFVKNQVDELAKYFKRVHVIVLSPYLPKILKKLKIIKGYNNRLNTKDYSYSNINVYYTKYFKLPNKITYKTFNLYNNVLKTININKINFDLVHTHFIYPSGLIGRKLKEKFNKKLIVTGHGFDVYDFPFKNKRNKMLTIKTLKKCDYFTTVSKKNLDIINSLIDIKNKSVVIPNGFDNKIFKPLDKIKCRKKLKISLDKKIILTVGNLIPIKNHPNLLKSINLLKDKRKDFVCYIIGDGSYKNKLRERIKQLKLSGFVKMVGSKPHKEIPLWMNSSDLFVLPSYNEGNPTVLVESLSCGLPYIGTNVGGVKEITNSEDIGLIYNNPNDYKTLCELINIGLDKKWNKNKILKYSKQFTWKKIVEKIIKVYK